MKNFLVAIAFLAILSALPACKRLSCDKTENSKPANPPAAKA